MQTLKTRFPWGTRASLACELMFSPWDRKEQVDAEAGLALCSSLVGKERKGGTTEGSAPN